jgi:hypothetical protein
VGGAHNTALSLEEMNEEELERLRAQYYRLAEEARAHLQKGRKRKGGASKDEDQAEIGSSPGSGNAPRKASTAGGSS